MWIPITQLTDEMATLIGRYQFPSTPTTTRLSLPLIIR